MKKLKVAFAAVLLTVSVGVPMIQALPAQAAPVPVVATFNVNGELFKMKFTTQPEIDLARKVLAGTASPLPHPFGTIVYGSANENTGYGWHLEKTKWTEQATEVCDGLPWTDVEHHLVTSPYYCPWNAKLISLK